MAKGTRIYGANICFDCKNACGVCEWSEIDPKTGKPRFAPVPGWTIKEKKDGFRIVGCPKFAQLRRDDKCLNTKVYHNNFDKVKSVISTDKDGNEQWYPSVRVASDTVHVAQSGISQCCKGREGYHTAGRFRWRYAENNALGKEKSQ